MTMYIQTHQVSHQLHFGSNMQTQVYGCQLHARQFLQCSIVLSSLSCVSDFVKAKLWLRTFKYKRATYMLSMSEPSSHSAGSGEKDKNKQHTKIHISLAALKLMHVNGFCMQATRQWFPGSVLHSLSQRCTQKKHSNKREVNSAIYYCCCIVTSTGNT